MAIPLSDPYILLLLVGFVLTAGGWFIRQVILPGLDARLKKPVSDAETRLNALISTTHNESLGGLNAVNERITNAERRYDAAINDLREQVRR